ncbi:FtsW/RodA/SpoVE family cell cycle protein [Paenibacillus lautus]|uniref:FtsW/RodA/SpoVE family cell cycle protein n=1 Tax=Paenibacillus lautus TaxID=1401 RepID=A0A385TWN1_PAELA|nr:FtsW/RodA/SpoVE family cell cycle protein [Paenibacillus lautus]AYB46827.1 FtsW/RodA/SpoVE family cell cycle protein [Paenibacillus lautus]
MRPVEEYKVVQDFLAQVCKQVRARAMHPEIREELLGHIEERTELLMLEGNAEEPAVQEAVKQMGDPGDIGKSLHLAHRPQLDWKLLVLLALFLIIGLVGMLSVYYADEGYSVSLVERKLLYFGIGVLFLIGFYFLDYRKLKKYSALVFFLIVILMVISLVYGQLYDMRTTYINIGPVGVNIITFSLIPLLLALAGMKPPSQWGRWEAAWNILYRGVLPVVLYSMSSSIVYTYIYVIGFLVLTWRTSKSMKQFAMISALPLLGLAVFLFTRVDHLLFRWREFMNPSAKEMWYIGNNADAIQAAGWLGQGFGQATPKIPYVLYDNVFPYLIYCFGWLFGIVVGVLILLFLVRLWKISTVHKDPYAKHIAALLIVVFGFRLLWPLLMGLGILPKVTLDPPFFSYSGMNQILDMAAVGLLLSIYRRKNMIPSEVGEAAPMKVA